MYFIASPEQHLDFFHQREKELMRQAAEYRLARSARSAEAARSVKKERTGRWPRLTRKQREAHVSLAS